MARLTLEHVSVDFPIFGAHAASLKQTIASAATGGRIGRETGVAVIQALRDVSIDLKDGDRLGLVGHNGAGKSTLLRTLAGVYPPTRGVYSRTGTISSLIDPMLGIEMDATGYENITIRGLILGISRTEMARLVPEIAEFSGLGDYLAMPVRTYSTGMLMRLGFSIATSVRSDILLMDEWLSVGDAEFKQRAEERLREIVLSTGVLVLASHSRDLIERECNLVIELSHGSIRQAGPGPMVAGAAAVREPSPREEHDDAPSLSSAAMPDRCDVADHSVIGNDGMNRSAAAVSVNVSDAGKQSQEGVALVATASRVTKPMPQSQEGTRKSGMAMNGCPGIFRDWFSRLRHVRRWYRPVWSKVEAAGSWLPFFLLIAGVIAWWHPLTRHEVMMGDDLRAYEYFATSQDSFVDKVLRAAPADKFRPVHLSVQYLQFRLFGGNYQVHVWFNVLFYALLVCMLYRVLWRLSSRSAAIALPLTCLFMTARFSFFHISEVNGSLELLCVLWLILFLQAVTDGARDRRTSSFYWAGCVYALLIFTHERFLVAAPAILAILWLQTWLPGSARIALSVVTTAPVGVFLVVKKILLGSKLLVGTGGKMLSLSSPEISAFIGSGILNMVGVNKGPQYLSILDFSELPFAYKLNTVALAATFVLAYGLSAVVRAERTELRWVSAAVALFMGALLLSASVTFRQEFRWLAAPFVVALCWAAYSLSRLPSRRQAVGLACLLMLLSIGNDRLYFRHRENMYMFHSRGIADALARATVKRWGCEQETFFVQEFGSEEWIAPSRLFFKPFACSASPSIRYYKAAETEAIRAKSDGCVMLALQAGRPFEFREVSPGVVSRAGRTRAYGEGVSDEGVVLAAEDSDHAQ